MESINNKKQFTGYFAKKATMIYDGDKLRMTDANGFYDCVVKWHHGAYVVVFDDGGEYEWLSEYAMGYQYEIEVIGNIHETPNQP